MRRTSQRGFTLLESLLYVAILGIAVTIITSLAVALLEFDVRGSVRIEVEAAARRVFEVVEEAVHAAAAIDTANSTFASDQGRLTLTMRDAARSPTVFSLSGVRLEMSEAGGDTVALTPAAVEVARFRLTHLQPTNAEPGVRIELDLRALNPAADPARALTRTYQTGIVLR